MAYVEPVKRQRKSATWKPRRSKRGDVEVLDGAPPITLGNPFRLTDDDFNQLRQFIFQHTGISLSDHKRALVYSRLARRLRHFGFKTYTEYYRYLTEQDAAGGELVEMINAITTNKTSFFRESHHFDFLKEVCFPELRQRTVGGQRSFRVWSAASSTGEEPYTLAMVARDSLPDYEGWRIEIEATDIDTAVLDRAQAGLYTTEQAEGIPAALLHKYFMKGKGANAGWVKAGPAIQSLVHFQRLNLNAPLWPWREPFDVVFCRNVMIYFNRETQRELIRRIISKIKPGGYLMLGHSEFLHGQIEGVEHLRKNVYRITKGSRT